MLIYLSQYFILAFKESFARILNGSFQAETSVNIWEGLLKRNNNFMISPRAWGGSAEAECSPLYWSLNVPCLSALRSATVSCTTVTQMQRKQFISRRRLGLNSFKRTHCGLPLMKVRHLLIDTDALWLIMETKLSFPGFVRNGLLFTQLSSPTASVVVLSLPTLKISTAPCVSAVSSTALAVWADSVPGCTFLRCGEMLYRVSHFA